MADTPNPQGDKVRKPRPFGSFLLFLTVLVVVLLAFGGSHLTNRLTFTQDAYEAKLYSGEVRRQDFKGQNEVEGQLEDGSFFKVSFASLDEKQSLYQQLNAVDEYHKISADELLDAIGEGWYRPELARHITIFRDEPTAVGTEGQAPAGAVEAPAMQEDTLYVSVTARKASDWTHAAPPPPLPKQPGKIWLEVTGVDDLGGLKAGLAASRTPIEERSFDLRAHHGTSHGQASTSFAQILLIYGPWILIFGVFVLFMRQMRQQGTGAGVMSFGRSRAQLYSKENHTNITFDDVAGAQEAKDEVQEVVEFLKNPGRFTRIGGRIPRGVLLVGPPGCGKTLLAKAIAGEAEVPFFSISGSDFVEMFVGVGASRVRDLFKQARDNSPCIIFLDEIDAVGRRRGSGMGGGHDEREQTLNAILVEMDGFSTDEGIIVVAATNRPDVLDPALLRPGRFDREVTIDLPDLEGRREILEVHLKKVKVARRGRRQTRWRARPRATPARISPRSSTRRRSWRCSTSAT